MFRLFNSLISKQLPLSIQQSVERRRKEIIENKNLEIQAKSEIVDLFSKSQAASIIKGKSHFFQNAKIEKIKKYNYQSQ